MPKYYVSIPVGASVGGEFEAATKEEAIEKAIDALAYPGLCHQCSHSVDLGELIEHEATAEEI